MTEDEKRREDERATLRSALEYYRVWLKARQLPEPDWLRDAIKELS